MHLSRNDDDNDNTRAFFSRDDYAPLDREKNARKKEKRERQTEEKRGRGGMRSHSTAMKFCLSEAGSASP